MKKKVYELITAVGFMMFAIAAICIDSEGEIFKYIVAVAIVGIAMMWIGGELIELEHRREMKKMYFEKRRERMKRSA